MVKGAKDPSAFVRVDVLVEECYDCDRFSSCSSMSCGITYPLSNSGTGELFENTEMWWIGKVDREVTIDAIDVSDALFLFHVADDMTLTFAIDSLLVGGAALVAALLVIGIKTIRIARFRNTGSLEIEEAELGLGSQKITLRPNDTDRQIAYKIWVELTTRKIGLDIDLDNDVIFEVYNSWYAFFTVTRELLKDVPSSKIDRRETKEIVKLTVRVLNDGIRPHLTKWQARFRHWYEKELSRDLEGLSSPQEIQRRFKQFDRMSEELIEVNASLIRFRDQMYKIVIGQTS